MLQITKRVNIENVVLDATLSLSYDLRQKSRVLVTLDNGNEAGIILPRGTRLREGDVLQADSGLFIGVFAAPEEVTTARCADALLFAKACYHLGNRHVPLQIGDACLRYKRDHVLDDMLLGLGLQIEHEVATFEPEPGAYDGHVQHE